MPLSRNGRAGALIIAVLLAGFATVALFAYMRNVERQAIGRSEPVAVLVAGDAIAEGTTGEDVIGRRLVVEKEIPRLAIVDGAITSVDDLKGKVATSDIVKGEQIVGERFAEPTHQTAIDIPAGHQAMAVELGPQPGVAGFVGTGDHVSIIAQAGKGDATGDTLVQYLMQDVEVLAVGKNARANEQKEGEIGGDQPAILLTLAVTPVEAEKLAYAIFRGEVYFTLQPTGFRGQQTPGRTANDLFS